MLKPHCDCCDREIVPDSLGHVRGVTIGAGYNMAVTVIARMNGERLELCDDCIGEASLAIAHGARRATGQD